MKLLSILSSFKARLNSESRSDQVPMEVSSEEQTLRELLLKGEATSTQGQRLYTLMTERGAAFPIEWEEKVLVLSMKDMPDRQDLVSRLLHVLKAQGKAVPSELEEAFQKLSNKQEWERDHQKDAFEYNSRSGLMDVEECFLPIFENCRRYSMTSAERMYALYKAARYVIEAGIPGDFVECGVWRGGSMMVVAQALLEKGIKDRDLYLFDTFEGLPKPDESKDIDLWGNRAIDGWRPLSKDDEKSGWANAGLDEVRKNLLSTGYPAERIHFVKGMVERTIPEQAPQDIALLRLDTDWYESTKHELEHLYPRLAPQGVMIIDDYGHFKGAKEAVDEYIETNRIAGLLCRIDYTGRLMIKPI